MLKKLLKNLRTKGKHLEHVPLWWIYIGVELAEAFERLGKVVPWIS